ncbi:MAG TPA: energy-coupling factor transporter transmembrane component T [Bacillota bacterium]|nr:energy-coupling factor transporter transmembrane component T [Bacillota bacterium]
MAFEEHNPTAVFLYFMIVMLITMFCMNPVILMLSLTGALCLYCVRNAGGKRQFHLFIAVLFTLTALINPIFYHNGVTVLFVVNDSPITLEAAVYGVFAGLMICTTLYWFRSFSEIFTSDRLLYVFGSFSPKVALLLSMTLRFIPLFRLQTKKTEAAQKALGLYCADSLPDTVRAKARVFSVMVTWGLENGIITADSMSARGYGTGRRTRFSRFRFRRCDAFLLSFSLAVGVFTAIMLMTGALDFAFYPKLCTVPLTIPASASYICFGALALAPSFIEIKESLKWKYLLSKI